jgi:hypothetical protein
MNDGMIEVAPLGDWTRIPNCGHRSLASREDGTEPSIELQVFQAPPGCKRAD